MLEPLGFPLPGREGMKGRVMQAMRSVLARVLFGLSYLSAPPPQPMLFPPILSFPRKGGRDIRGEDFRFLFTDGKPGRATFSLSSSTQTHTIYLPGW